MFIMDKDSIPWVEKYRPDQLDNLVSREDIVATLNKFLNANKLPHLLFYGPPGSGKTTTILAIAKRLYEAQGLNSMVLELNASDDRGIAVVRQQIQTFASTKSVFSSGTKLIILDEADSMTRDAQNSLRRIIEKFTDNVRFCLICNYLSKIIPAIQSRCTRFRFSPLSAEHMLTRVKEIVSFENLKSTDDGLKAVVRLSSGDMRRSLNILQAAAMAFDVVDEDNVYICVGHPLRQDMETIISWLLNEDFATAYRNILDLKSKKGLALVDILAEIHECIFQIEFPTVVRIILLKSMADIEDRLSVGTNENFQLGSLVAVFADCKKEIFQQLETQ